MAIFLLVFILPTLTLSQLLKSHYSGEKNELAVYLKRISSDYFRDGITLIIFNQNGLSDYPDVAVKIMADVLPTQVSNNGYQKPDWFYLMFLMDSATAHNIIIFLEGLDVATAFMDYRNHAMWNSQARMLLIIDCEDTCKASAEMALKAAWTTTKSLNIVVMTVGKRMQFFSCSSYTKCDSEFNELAVKENFYPSKIPENFDGSDFTIATTVKEPYVLGPKNPLQYSEGVEIKILSVIAKKLNFALKFKESPPGESPYITYDKNKKRVGLLGLLYRNEADLACFGTGLGNDRYYAATALVSHTQDTLVWMAPAPELRSNWDSVYIAFSADIWILVLVLLITTAIIFRALSSETPDRFLFPNLSKCVLDSWSATLNLGVPSRPKSGRMKCFLTVVLLYAVIISSAYQSILITFLTSKRRATGFRSIEEAVDAGIVAYIFPSGMYMYNQSKHEMWNKILAKGGHVLDGSYNYTKTLNIVEKPPYAVSLMIRYSAEFIVRKYFLRHSGALVRTLSPYFTTYPITFYMSPGHPLQGVFNANIARLIEAGLPEKWLRDVLHGAEYREHGQEDDNGLRKPLSLSHLEVTFLILGFGLSISLISFILEVAISTRKKRSWRTLRPVLSFSTTFISPGSLPRSMSRGRE